MRILDTLLGRTKPKVADLDALFALPTAAITLQAELELTPAGFAAVALKPATSDTFEAARTEFEQLVALSSHESGTAVGHAGDEYGYQWLLLTDPDLEDLVGATHLVSTTLTDHGYGTQLLCAIFEFQAPNTGAVHVVYLYKRGTFYPFAPREDQHRDNELELRVRRALQGDLPIETDLNRWFPLWGIPRP